MSLQIEEFDVKTKFSVMFTGMHPMNMFVPWAQKLEASGFDEILIADDLIFRPAWPILTLIGANTSTIRVGPAIVNPITAHPVYQATNVLALDELTEGRAVCAMGRGAFNANLKLEDTHRPVRMIREAYETMKYVIQGQEGGYEGDFFDIIPEYRLEMERFRDDIPILIGSWSPQMSRLAGKHSAGLIAACCSGRDTMSRLIEQTHAGAASAGRDPSELEIASAPLASISMDREAAVRGITDLLGVLMPGMPALTQALGMDDEEVANIHSYAMADDFDTVAKLVPDKAVKAFALAGTPEDVIPQIEEMIDIGVNHINFTPPIGPDVDEALDLIATKILPHFQNPDFQNPDFQN